MENVLIELRFFDGVSWSTVNSMATYNDGLYAFLDVPGLAPGQKYYVLYRNIQGFQDRLWAWATRELTAYMTGSSVAIGDFDIANIPLLMPPQGVEVTLPYTFQWIPRSLFPADVYEFNLYDPYTFEPYFFAPVGYADSYSLSSLPVGFDQNTLYVWEIRVHSPDGGVGISYEARDIYFSNTWMNVKIANEFLLPKIISDIEILHQR